MDLQMLARLLRGDPQPDQQPANSVGPDYLVAQPNPMQGYLSATPRTNPLAGYAADALGALTGYASRPDPTMPGGLANPALSAASNLIGLPAVQRTLDRYSYGQPLTNAGKANVPLIPQDTADAAMAVAPLAAKFPRAAAGAAMGLAGAADTGGMSLAATVWHGSPHKFDAFDASKIGKGEGAQIYGHGIYFAEEPQVAEEYARKLSKPFAEFDKQPSNEYEQAVSDAINSAIQRAQYDSRTKFANDQFNAIANPIRDRLYGNAYAGLKPMPKEQLDRALAMQAAAESLGRPRISDAGSLYKVDLPDSQISKMLDWDAGGEDVWRDAVAKHGSAKKAAQALRSQGIPGIRYLDDDSRSAGAGTSNYVVFPGEENILSILSRNGKPVK